MIKKTCNCCYATFVNCKNKKFCSNNCYKNYRLKLSTFPVELTEEQQEIITGNLLGDGGITFPKNGNENCQFCISQSLEKTEYIDFLFKTYSPFSLKCRNVKTKKPSRVNGKISHDDKHWQGEYCYRCGIRTVCHPIFTKMRNQWYQSPKKGSPKIIPQDLRLTWRTVAFWACDDGSNAIKHSRCFTLHTECFTEEHVEFLINKLKNDLGVYGKLIRRSDSGKPIICFYGEEHDKFVVGIKPYISCECFKKKCIRKYLVKKRTVYKNLKNMWIAKITINQKTIWLGSFKNKNDAENVLKTAESMKKLGIKDENKYIDLRQKLRANNTTGVSGLFHQDNRWLPNINVNGTYIYLGSFKNRDDAIEALETANKLKSIGITDIEQYKTLRPSRKKKQFD